MNEYNLLKPSKEQKDFIEHAKSGKNILVDACIGSGKTTAIQKLCMSLPRTKRILYLTYNKLLKIDAQDKIKTPNVLVQNYHGFAYMMLSRAGMSSGISDLIQTVNRNIPPIPKYDVLIIDEYQDIDDEISKLLINIKNSNPDIQLIAVGDMRQKIYDKTTINVPVFMNDFLDTYIQLEFTQCFRLSNEYAQMLGRIWNKDIIGVNSECEIEIIDQHKVIKYLANQDTKDVMCLGARTGVMSQTLNILETNYPEKYNKSTVYASISDKNKGAVTPQSDSAIFTTFDSSKGMERNICIIFDYDISYWHTRLNKPQQKYDILRNIFLVAASRGKKKIMFVQAQNKLLNEKTLSKRPQSAETFEDTSMDGLFAFKYKENIEEAYNLLEINEVMLDSDYSLIDVKETDGLIDLAPCHDLYQKVDYFNNYNLDIELDLLYQQRYHSPLPSYYQTLNVDEKILLYVSLKTNQMRYRNQVETPYIDEIGKRALENRLSTQFDRNEQVQYPSSIEFQYKNRYLFEARGYVDVVKDDTAYTLCFADEIQHESYLEAACYMIGAAIPKCRIWNIKTNRLYDIKVKDEMAYMNKVLETATKGVYKHN